MNQQNKPWIHQFQGLLNQSLTTLPNEFTLSISGGIDSSMILFELVRMNKLPKELITFQIDNWETNDLFYSKRIAEEYNIPLKIVNIPIISRAESEGIVKKIIDVIGLVRKIDIQVCYAFEYMLKEVSTKHLVLGLYEDIIYETNAKLNIKHKDVLRNKLSMEDFEDYYKTHKRLCYEDKNRNGIVHNHVSIIKYIEHYGIQAHTPLKTKEIYELFQTVSYEETNIIDGKLKKKWFVTDVMYKDEFDKIGNHKNNSNMHAKKSGNDLNQLHEIIFKPKGNIIKVYNEISKHTNTKNHNFF